MLTPANTARTLARLLAACALALACIGSWAGPWEAGATPIFRHAVPSLGFMPSAMLQDRNGLIWIASQSGLVRWDGYRLRRYGADARQQDGLASSFIVTLHEDAAGMLWIATDGGGLARFNPATGKFSTLAEGPEGLSSARVASLAADGHGGLWVGTGKGLNHVDLATGQVQREPRQGIPTGLPAHRIGSLLLDRRGNLWAGMVEGLFVLSPGARAFQPVPLPGKERAEDVRLLQEDDAGRLWIGTRATGVFFRDPATGTIRQVMDSERGGTVPLEMDLRAIADAGNAEVWLGTWGQGIVRVDTASWSTKHVRHDRDIAAGLATDFVSVLFRDRSGLVWAAGLDMLDATAPLQQKAVATWYGGGGRLTGGASAQVASLLAAADGSVWVGNAVGGIDVIPPDRGPTRHLLPQEGQPRQALPAGAVLGMAAAPDGRVFAGTLKGLYVVHPGGYRVERLELPGAPPTELIQALCLSGERLWIGLRSGLRYLDLSSPQPVPGKVAALANVSVNALNCDPQGQNVWVGTLTGLLRYRPDTDTVDRPGQPGLPAGNVSSAVMDRQGRLWVGYYGAGVCRADPPANGAAGRVRCIGHDEGIPDGAVNALALDAQGNAWASTDNGLVRVDRDTLHPKLLQTADGVGLLAYWNRSVAQTPEGDILFGSGGLTIVHPAEFKPWQYKAPIVLSVVGTSEVLSREIRLGPSTRSVQLGFALLDYSAPEQVRYAYRLAGLEEAWTEAPADTRIARYTNIRPGEYSFEVKAQNRTGEWITQRWPLHVEPAWYETTPFRLAAGIAALLLAWAMVRLRMQWLVHRANELREQVAQRTQELQQRTEQLEASRQALRELGAHNARSLEDERKRVARELHDELGQQLAAMRMEMSVLKARAEAGKVPDADQWVLMRERVDRLTTSMRRLVSDLRPPALDGGLEAALQWLGAEYERTSGVPCKVELDPGARTLTPEAKTMVFRVAQESLNNVLRHADPGSVHLQLKHDDEGWDLRVKDDGVGFDTGTPSRGFGLLSMEERAQLIGGTLRIDSRPGHGTCVHLHLPATAEQDSA